MRGLVGAPQGSGKRSKKDSEGGEDSEEEEEEELTDKRRRKGKRARFIKRPKRGPIVSAAGASSEKGEGQREAPGGKSEVREREQSEEDRDDVSVDYQASEL